MASVPVVYKNVQSKFSDKQARISDFLSPANYRVASQLRGLGLTDDITKSVFDAYEKSPYLDLLVEFGGGTSTRGRDVGPTPFSGAQRSKTEINAVGPFWGARDLVQRGAGAANANDPFFQQREDYFRKQSNFAGFETMDLLGQTTAQRSFTQLKKDQPLSRIEGARAGTPNVAGFAGKNVTYNVGDKGYEDVWKELNQQYLDDPKKFKGGEIETITETGYLVNNAFVEEDLYNQFSDEHKQLFGLDYNQAAQVDPSIAAVRDIGEVGFKTFEAWEGAKQKGGAIGAVKNFAVPALGLAGALTGQPWLTAFAGGAAGAQGGGGLKGILAGAGLGYLGGKLSTKLPDILGGEAGSIWDIKGANVGPLGAAANTTSSGTGNMSFLSDIFSGAKSLFSSAGGGLKDILSGTYNALGGSSGLLDLIAGKDGLLRTGGELIAQRDASRSQEKASNQAIGLADPLAAYRPGYAASLHQLVTNPQAALSSDPSFNFRFNQGEEAVRRKAAASGNRFSGAGLLASQEYGQNFASQEFEKEFQRRLTLATGSPHAANIQAGQGANQYSQTLQQYGAIGDLVRTGTSSLANILARSTGGGQAGTPGINPQAAPPLVDQATYDNLYRGYQ